MQLTSRPTFKRQARSPQISLAAEADATTGQASPQRGSRGQAKVLDEEQIQQVLNFIRLQNSEPESDEVKFLLSVRAGLRASEIAALDMDALVTADRRIGKVIEIRAEWSKSKRPRSIPMHPDVRNALGRLRKRFPQAMHVAIAPNSNGTGRQSANAVTLWFARLYAAAGLRGCSSHSGRRSFITSLARRANEFNTSLRDVQHLAGHARLDTTERYIEPSLDLSALVHSLGAAVE